jgi:hypothetical protein
MNNNYLIGGSVALNYLLPDNKENRKPKDIDVFIYDNITEEDKKEIKEYLFNLFNIEKIEFLVNPILLDYYSNKSTIISLDDLYTLKVSHLFWDINWEKHMYDSVRLNKLGCVLNEELFNKLYGFWLNYHNFDSKLKVKRSNLNMKLDDFFDNNIKCEIKHDDIHEIINPNPIYKKIIVQEGYASTDEDKWNNLGFEDKIKLIQEETMVMAYERLNNRYYKAAYNWQLKQLILKHLPFCEAKFAIINYKELVNCPFDYVKLINNKKINKNGIN